MSGFYAFTDKCLKYLRRFYVKEYKRTEIQIRADSLNVIEKTTALYDRLYSETIKIFHRIAKKKYKECCGADTLEMAWLMGLLSESDPLTGYIFLNDKDRKRQYYAESIMSGGNISAETKKAMRYLYGSVSQYADIVTDAASLKAYADTNTEFVRWIAQEDGRTCGICGDRNGNIYPIKYVPKKPHYRCRCYLVRA